MLKQHFFATPAIARYSTFSLYFQMGMAISLAAMPVYFKQQDAVSVYGSAYAVMAVAGAFSFVYGFLIDRIGFAKALLFGALLYAIALSMRIFTEPVIAIITAIMAGAGASTAMLANRSWTLSISESSTHNTTELTAMRSILASGAMLVGTGLVSLLAYLFENVYAYLLLLAGALVFVAALFTRHLGKDSTQRSNTKNNNKNKDQPKAQTTVKGSLSLAVLLFVFSDFIAGIYTGLFKPYLILMFIDYGMSESASVFIFLLTTLVSVVSGVVLLKYQHVFKHRAFISFYVSIAGLMAAYFLMSFVLKTQMAVYLLMLITLMRSLCLSLSGTFEQVVQYDLLDKTSLGVALGFTQTAFLAGDALGALITGLWFMPEHVGDYAKICLCCGLLVVVQLLIIARLKTLKPSNT